MVYYVPSGLGGDTLGFGELLLSLLGAASQRLLVRDAGARSPHRIYE